ncbi:IS200/IS605 family transposase [Planktosalinus lacus]|uniref:Transposase n=1 Tax=Planktosalinus lacus TaxID=1526573 RepID=A0A8J2V8Y3_9FLAO|nr:IS200/IS605 family transposase [Planktosalinus lacus]GGD85023.1 transposase [Planktosalinus lacus]
MADTYTQLYVQIVFAVQGRVSLIRSAFEDELYKYITGIIQNRKHKMLAINGMPDHIHIFLGLHPSDSISDLVREIKKASNAFMNERRFSNYPFQWQSGYGAFTYKRSDIDTVVNYVLNQKEHHRKKSFKEEYIEFLKEFEIEYKEQYLFEWYGNTP